MSSAEVSPEEQALGHGLTNLEETYEDIKELPKQFLQAFYDAINACKLSERETPPENLNRLKSLVRKDIGDTLDRTIRKEVGESTKNRLGGLARGSHWDLKLHHVALIFGPAAFESPGFIEGLRNLAKEKASLSDTVRALWQIRVVRRNQPPGSRVRIGPEWLPCDVASARARLVLDG